MAPKPSTIGKGVKYAVKYGPHLVAVAKIAKDPAQAAAQRALTNGRNRRAALAHAATVTQGSVLKVFVESEPVWVVFSGEEPVAFVPPEAAAGATVALTHADLSQRERPQDAPTAMTRVKGLVPRRRRPS